MPRDIGQIVNEQVSVWQKRAELFSRNALPGPAEKATDARPKVVTIAAQMGANGRSIGAQAAALLGIPNYDRDILQYIADSAQVSISAVETLDERARSRVEEYISSLLNSSLLNAVGLDGGDYLRTLGRVVAALWEHGPCVLTGHGCVHMIPRESALTVRLIAPEEVRIVRIAECAHMTTSDAQRRILESDREREMFHRRYFKVDVHDLMLYDLVLNTGSLNDATCAQIVSASYRSKFRPADEPAQP